jgi:hypothetical protein
MAPQITLPFQPGYSTGALVYLSYLGGSRDASVITEKSWVVPPGSESTQGGPLDEMRRKPWHYQGYPIGSIIRRNSRRPVGRGGVLARIVSALRSLGTGVFLLPFKMTAGRLQRVHSGAALRVFVSRFSTPFVVNK